MRVFLHGQSPTCTLLAKLNEVQDSPVTSIYLSSWTLVSREDENEASLLMALSSFLYRHHGMAEVILRNCSGENLRELIFLLLQSSPDALTIRYDRQQHMPTSIPVALANGPQSRIRRLNFEGVTLDPELLQALEYSLPQKFRGLEKLSVKGNILLSDADKGVSILGKRCDSESYFMIEDSVNRFTSLLLELPNLQFLELENCHLDDEQLAMLINAALSSSDVRTLNLRGNQSQEATMSTLGKHLSSPESRLETLDLTWQRLPNQAGSVPLQRPTLHSAPATFHTTQPMDGIPMLAKAVKSNRCLRNLILSENKIREIDVEMLVEALQVNSTLECLELKDCRLRSNSLRCLANALPNLQLKTLHIDGCQKISPKHEEKAMRSLFLVPLAKNPYMEDLEMNYRSQSMDWLLDWNKSGRPDILNQSQIPSSLAPTLAGMQGNVIPMMA